MSDLDPERKLDAVEDGANEEEDLAAAYEALAEDRLRQEMERGAVNAARPSNHRPINRRRRLRLMRRKATNQRRTIRRQLMFHQRRTL